MASLETRANKGRTSYRIVWREDGEKQGETFPDRKSADKFRQLVEGSGNRWPNGWVPRRGFAEVAPSGLPAFADWAARTIAARARANDRTRDDYTRDIRLHLNPTFGDMRLDEITREDVGQWLIGLTRTASARTGKPVTAKTVKNVHGLASSILADAVDAGLLGRNVFKGAAGRLPVVKTEEMVFLSRQDVNTLTAATREHYRPMVLFLVLTGLRWSEATALTVSDVQLMGRQVVTVTKAWKRQPGGYMELGEPKSRRSRRTVSLPAEAVEALIPLVSGRAGAERLFTSATGMTVHHGNFRHRAWLPALKAATANGLEKRPRIHDLRHTHASWLIAEGVNLVAVQRRLGHESIQTTIDRYGHLADEADDHINAALDRLAGRSLVVQPATFV